MIRFLAIPVVAICLLAAAPLSGQSVEELQNQMDDLVDELEEYKELYLQLSRKVRDMREVSAAEVATLTDMLNRLKEEMGAVVPDYLASDEEEFDNKIRRILDDRFREYTRGSDFLKGVPGEDAMVDRVAKSFGYLTVGAKMVTAGQVFSGLDPFDDRPDLQRVLALTRLSLKWRPSENLTGVIEGQWFGNFGASDTRFEDYYLVTPRSGSGRALPIELTQPRELADADLDPLLVNPKEIETPNDVLQLYQAYFDVKNLFDLPAGLRVGRQELVQGESAAYGNEFLYGNNDSGDLFFGLSLDGVKLMMADAKENPKLQVDMFWYKPDELEETAFLEDDSSPDFVGIYATYKGLAENEMLAKLGLNVRKIDMGWTLIRNPGTSELQEPSPLPFGMRNTFFGQPIWRNDPAQRFIDRSFADVRFLESDEMMTLSWFLDVGIGKRVNTQINFAYQYGDTAEKRITSALTVISPLDGFPINPGDITLASGDYDSVAGDIFVDVDLSDTLVDAQLSDTTSLSPRIGGGYAYFRGGNADDFLAGDIKTFQRIAADRQYGEIMDRAPFGTFLSNTHIAQGKLGLTLSDKLSFEATVFGYWVDQPTDPNGPFFGANQDIFELRKSLQDDLRAFAQPGDPAPEDVISTLSDRARKPRRHLGTELDTLLTYVHSPQMSVFLGYSHFWDGAYFQDVASDTNTLMHEIFGDDFGKQFDMKGGKGQDYMFVQVKVDF